MILLNQTQILKLSIWLILKKKKKKMIFNQLKNKGEQKYFLVNRMSLKFK